MHLLTCMQVIEFEDRYLVPLPPLDPLRNYTAALRGGVDETDIKPLLISQTEGPSFRVHGYAVELQSQNIFLKTAETHLQNDKIVVVHPLFPSLFPICCLSLRRQGGFQCSPTWGLDFLTPSQIRAFHMGRPSYRPLWN